MKTVKKTVVTVCASGVVHKVNLLDPQAEPSDAALESIMCAVQRSAKVKSEQANRELFDRLARETKAARLRFNQSHRFAPAA